MWRKVLPWSVYLFIAYKYFFIYLILSAGGYSSEEASMNAAKGPGREYISFTLLAEKVYGHSLEFNPPPTPGNTHEHTKMVLMPTA